MNDEQKLLQYLSNFRFNVKVNRYNKKKNTLARSPVLSTLLSRGLIIGCHWKIFVPIMCRNYEESVETVWRVIYFMEIYDKSNMGNVW